MADRQKSKQARDLIPNFKKKMDEIDDLIEISPELDQKMLKLISNTTATKQALKFNDYWLCLVNKIGAKTRSIILFFRINNFSYNPFILIATLIIIVISLGSYYLVYRKQTNIIANQETPAIKVTPNSSDTPIATPSPIQTISPDIAKSPEKNINNEKTLNKLNEKKNNKDLTAKRQENRNKPNTKIQSNNPIPQNNNLDNKDNQQEEMAITKVQPNNPTSQNNNLDNKDNQQGDLTTVTRGNNAKLATIKNIYVSNFIEKNLRNALIELLKDKGFNVFENLANANTPIDAQLEYNLPETNALILSINNKTVFEKSLTGVSPKEHAQTIVSSLIEAIERNKTEQKQK